MPRSTRTIENRAVANEEVAAHALAFARSVA
jgi:hypothetical protein